MSVTRNLSSLVHILLKYVIKKSYEFIAFYVKPFNNDISFYWEFQFEPFKQP